MRHLILKWIVGLIGMLGLAGVAWWKAPALQHRWMAFSVPEPVLATLDPDRSYLGVVFIGQSNAANHGSSRTRVDGPDRAWYAGQAFRLQDPLPGCSGVGGSVGVQLAATGKPAAQDAWLIACSAQGATAIEDWHPSSQLFASAEQAVRQLAGQIKTPLWIIVHQGETDAWRDSDASQYEANLRALIEALSTSAPNARFLLCQTSVWGETSGIHPGIRKAQENVWSSLSNVWAGVDTDSFPATMRSVDGVHFNHDGLVAFAALLKESMDNPSDLPKRYSE